MLFDAHSIPEKGGGGGGGGYSHIKVTGSSSDFLKATPKRYQDLVFGLGSKVILPLRGTKIEHNLSNS